ncbi:TNF receptor-associated factor 3-like [Mizuhopecten yessoensis]|nr:TNF receptor-associated factor 3-like [Mizuhopecten yessoensis]XP_021361306.1 TNF receptor-associated factor 3-like [Mizuhopecten yessoensis]
MAISLGSMSSASIPMQQTPVGNPDFVKLDPKYKCLKCRKVLRDAVQTLCGHRMCEICAFKAFDEPPPIRCPGNEDTCVPILQKEEIFRDPSARREIRTLPVYCTYKNQGCQLEMQWKQLEEHELSCEYKPVQCSFVRNGCGVCTIIQKLEEHLKECEYRNITCTFCRDDIIFNQKQEHESAKCRKFPIPCPNGCGIEKLPRDEMREHEPECPKKPIHCKFTNVGCEFSGSKEDVKKHEQESIDHHLQLTTVYTASIDLQSMEIRREIQDISASRESYKRTVDLCLKEVTTVKDGLEVSKMAVKDMKLKAVALTERVIHLERRVEDLAKKDTVEKQGRDIQTLRDGQTNISDRVTQIERNGLGGGQGEGVPGNVANQLQNHERQIGLMDVRVAELDLRLQIHETASFNGVLMWKIRDYARRKQEAITGRTLSLYSQPFYTSQFGYKMCARVYLNGDGMGKGTHMSLFFVVMRGDFDTLLPWPFQQKVNMMLLDQDTGARHLSDTFRPDPNSNSFRRPQTEMNIASGCPLFVSHTVLETRTYLHEDTIFIKIDVDINGINPP